MVRFLMISGITGRIGVSVKDAMSSRVFTVQCLAHEALNLMVEHDIHHLPVVPVEIQAKPDLHRRIS